MALLKFPDDTRNPIECADWMELQVLLSPERRCSVAAVERNIKRLSLSDEKRAIQQIAETETASSEVLGEIKRRQQAATAAYPFSLSGTELILSGDIKDFAAYIFCLCLSRFGWKHRKGGKTFPRRMFEDLAKHAAELFVGGKALRFGAPRTELPSSFQKALHALRMAIGEGEVRRRLGQTHAQDDALDLVAWRDFPDCAEGKLFLVGQCASGTNWESKKRELDAEAFFDDWFSDRPPSVRSMRIGLFIPHRVSQNKWIPITRRTGIIFDRCRIAHLSHINPNFTDRERYVEWCKVTLAGVHTE